jgi:hypothetical protein
MMPLFQEALQAMSTVAYRTGCPLSFPFHEIGRTLDNGNAIGIIVTIVEAHRK